MSPEDHIAEIDKTLAIVRDGWLTDKAKWDERMNTLLEQRFELMKKRDENHTPETVL